MSVVSFCLSLADPRGRCDRTGLLLVALGMVAVEVLAAALIVVAGAELDGAAMLILKLACVWLATTVVIKRLHDLGLPGWRMLWVLLAVIAWGVALTFAVMMTLGDAALAPGAIGYNLTVAGTALPVLLATLWLHFARGETGDNRYGPEPSGWGFSHPAFAGFDRGHSGDMLPASG